MRPAYVLAIACCVGSFDAPSWCRAADPIPNNLLDANNSDRQATNHLEAIAEYEAYTPAARSIGTALTKKLRDNDIFCVIFGSRGSTLYVKAIDRERASLLLKKLVRTEALRVRLIEHSAL